MTSPYDTVSVRYMVDDVQAAVDFYTGHLGFAPRP
jgi:catechol 2,3-dioxygenase-like lactoylglutathione lyase family enzyme